MIDYDWVNINERKYLLPSQSIILMTSNNGKFLVQTKNDVRFRSYQKFGAELKVIEVDGDEDEPLEGDPPPPPKPKPDKPEKPPQ
jgi:hypothetical protein